MKTPRINELDALRAFAFLFVVAQHIFGGFAWREAVDPNQSLVLSFLYVIAKPAVPIFLTLLGITLFLSCKNRKPDFKEFYKKKFIGIFIPYVIWSIVIIIYNENYEKFSNILGVLVTGDAGYHLWYMGMLERIFLFFPLLWLITNRIYSLGKAWRGILFTLFVIAYWMLNNNDPIVTNSIAHFIFGTPSYFEEKFISISPILWCLYLVIGIRIAFEYENFVSFIEKRKVLILGIYPLLLAYNYYDEIKYKIGIKESDLVHSLVNYSHHVLYISFMVSSIIVFYLVSRYIYCNSPRAFKLFRHIAKYSYMGYLIHTCVIAKAASPIIVDGRPYSLPLDIAIYLVTIFFSIEIPHLISYLPYSKFLTGSKRNTLNNLKLNFVFRGHDSAKG